MSYKYMLQKEILNIISQFTDPSVRIDIAATIFYLADLYATGKITLEQLRNDIYEIITDIVDVVEPFLPPEEKSKKAKNITEKIVKAIKIATMRRRMIRRW